MGTTLVRQCMDSATCLHWLAMQYQRKWRWWRANQLRNILWCKYYQKLLLWWSLPDYTCSKRQKQKIYEELIRTIPGIEEWLMNSSEEEIADQASLSGVCLHVYSSHCHSALQGSVWFHRRQQLGMNMLSIVWCWHMKYILVYIDVFVIWSTMQLGQGGYRTYLALCKFFLTFPQQGLTLLSCLLEMIAVCWGELEPTSLVLLHLPDGVGSFQICAMVKKAHVHQWMMCVLAPWEIHQIKMTNLLVLMNTRLIIKLLWTH